MDLKENVFILVRNLKRPCNPSLLNSSSHTDTEGSFVVERAREIAEALSKHLIELTADRPPEEQEFIQKLTPETFLSRIYYYRIHDYVEQVAIVHMLPHILQYQYPKVKLIVIDSITFHFRYDFEDFSKRTRMLTSMAQKLMLVAEKFSTAVVIINQMTTKVANDNESTLVPALGETWAHVCPTRVILYWENGVRFAHLYKSPTRKAATVQFTICAEGIR